MEGFPKIVFTTVDFSKPTRINECIAKVCGLLKSAKVGHFVFSQKSPSSLRSNSIFPKNLAYYESPYVLYAMLSVILIPSFSV